MHFAGSTINPATKKKKKSETNIDILNDLYINFVHLLFNRKK